MATAACASASWTLPSGLAALLALVGAAAADVATDGTVGPRLQLPGPDVQIGADLGTRAGANLFHSFERFSIGTGESATFSGPDEVRHVIGRVTGGAPSEVDGTLRSTIPGADLYFINPAGVAFGPDARLDVQGSFHVSSADELRFADGAIFSARDPAASTFTIAAPEAFGFLGAAPAAITVDGSQLAVPPGEALSIEAGAIAIGGGGAGFLAAEAGALHLAAHGASGDIVVADRAVISTSGDGGGRIDIRARNLAIVDRSLLDASNTGAGTGPGGIEIRLDGQLALVQSLIGAGSFGEGAAGGIVIDARGVILHGGQIDASSFATGSATGIVLNATEQLVIGGIVAFDQPGASVLGFRPGLFAFTRGEGAGGDIALAAGSIVMTDAGLIEATSSGPGPGGAIVIEAERVQLSDQAAISAETFGAGAGGSITIEAAELDVDNAFIGSSTAGSGAGGTVVIEAGRIRIANEGRIFNGAGGSGAGGTIVVSAGSLAIDGALDHAAQFGTGISASVNPDAGGAGGDVTVVAGEILLENEGHIANDTDGLGRGGAVVIEADRLVLNQGFIGANTTGPADAGSVVIRAGRVEFVNEGRVFNGTDGDGDGGAVLVEAEVVIADGTLDHVADFHTGISASANFGSTGAGGDVEVRAPQVILLEGGEISSDTDAGGPGGAVTVRAQEIRLARGGQIFTTSSSTGDAGSILIVATDSLRLDEGRISTEAEIAGGGRIDLVVARLLDLRESGIATSVSGGPGTTAGDITIDPRFIVLDRSFVRAQADAGRGGNIQITVDQLFRSPGSEISASAGPAGIDGTVNISSPDADLSGDLVILEGAFLDAAGLLRERCAARRDVGASSFTGVGRGRLPPDPDRPLASGDRNRADTGGGAGGGAVEAELGLLGAPTERGTLALVPMLLVQPCSPTA